MADASAKDLRNLLEQYSQIVIKACFIINGGAAGAVLAYVGTSAGAVEKINRDWAITSLILFALGVFCAAVVTFLAHRSVYWLYQEKQDQDQGPSHNADNKHNAGKRNYLLSNKVTCLSFLFYLLGVCAFSWSLLDSS